MIDLTYKELVALDPCADRLNAATRRIGGTWKWGSRKVNAAEAVQAGMTLDDIVWVASALSRINPDVERRLRLWMADCAAHVLPIFEKVSPNDNRPRDAILAARAFARGGCGVGCGEGCGVGCGVGCGEGCGRKVANHPPCRVAVR